MSAATPHRLTRGAAAAAVALALLAPGAEAQPVPPAAPPAVRLDAALRRLVVDSVARVLEARYVDSSVARRIGARVRTRLSAGAYDGITAPSELGTALMRDLQGVVADKHLRVSYEPERDFALVGPPVRHGPAARVRMPVSGVPGPATAPGPGGARTPWLRIDGRDSATLARTNHAFERVERLPGNVGYLRLTEFVPLDLSRETWTAALNFLRHVDALVVDVRGNRGGAPEPVQWLLSHFLAEPTLLVASYNRAANTVFERWTERDVPGPRLEGVDLYVVQDRGSASAAETIGYVARQHRLGTVVGDTTAGAGNGGNKVSVGAGLALFIPQFRIVTGPGYERTGVAPDVWAPSDSAPAVAHRLALQRLAARPADPAVARERAWALELVVAAARPPRAADRPLAAFAGAFAGRRFEVRGNTLVHVGATGRVAALTRVDDLVFRSAASRFRFAVDGRGAATAVEVEPEAGAPVREARVAAGDPPR